MSKFNNAKASLNNFHANNEKNILIASRIAAYLVALGIVGYILVYLPIWDLLQVVAMTVIVPLAFCLAFGWVSLENVQGIIWIAKTGGGKMQKLVKEQYEKRKAA